MIRNHSWIVRGVRALTALALVLSVLPGGVSAVPASSIEAAADKAAVVNDASLAVEQIRAGRSWPDRVAAAAPAAIPPQVPSAVNIIATKRDALVNDIDNDGRADPGDTLSYTVVITNSGVTDATGVVFNDSIDGNTVLSGMVKSSPLARNDAYAAVGNVQILLPPGSGLLANDNDPDGGAISVVSSSTTSANGGNVAVNANGSFTYNPPAGFEGADSFTYTIQDTDGNQNSATVSINVGGMIWFINNNPAVCSSGCDGRLTTPFTTLAAFVANNNGAGNNPAANDNIFVYESATAYAGGVTLLNGQRLIGQDASSSLAALAGVTPPSYSAALPVMNTGGSAATINGGANAMALAQNNALYGFTAGTASNASINGSSFGTLLVNDVIINTTGAGLSLSTGAFGSPGNFTSITSGGGSNNVSLINVTGTANLGSGALSGASSHAFVIDGGTAALTYNGTINNTTARSVSVVNKTAGSVTFSGVVNGTAQGVFLNNNTGATITFSGGVSLSTGASAAFTATNGGTVNVCDENPCNPAATGALVNTLATTTGVALNVANTAIGPNGLEFRSISANGATNGIVLNNTGTAAGNGGLIVRSSGTADSGGVIQNTTGDGIVLASTKNSSFTRIRIQNAGGQGISGLGVNGFRLLNSTINGAGNADEENGIIFGSAVGADNGLVGTALIQDVVIDDPDPSAANRFTQWGLRVRNAAAGTLNLTLRRVTVQNNTGTFGEDAVSIRVEGGTTTVLVDDSDFIDTGGKGVDGQAGGNTSAALNMTIQNSTFLRNLALPFAFSFTTQGNATGRFLGTANAATSCTTAGCSSMGFDFNAADTSTLDATMTGNTANVTFGTGLEFVVDDNAIGKLNARNNIINLDPGSVNPADQQGMNFQARSVTLAGTGQLHLTLADNTINGIASSVFGFQGMNFQSGSSSTTFAHNQTLCANIDNPPPGNAGNNIVNGTGGLTAYSFRQRTGTNFQLQGLTGSGTSVANVQSFVQSNNAGGTLGGATTVAGVGGTTIVNYTNANCQIPTVPTLPPSVSSLTHGGYVEQAPDDGTMSINTSGGNSKPLLSLPFNPAFVPQLDRAVEINRVEAPIAPLNIGTLPAGKTITLTFEVVINNPVTSGATQVSNQGTVSGSNFSAVVTNDPDTPTANDPTVTPLDVQVDLQVTKTVNPVTAYPGLPITYTITYRNAGSQASTNVVITDPIPSALTGVAYQSSATITPTGSYVWAIGTLLNGQGGVITVSGTINPALGVPATITNTATITGTGRDTNTGNNLASVSLPIAEQPISGLAAVNDSPTRLGSVTAFTATITAGNAVSYTWDFGDDTPPATGAGANSSHFYAATGLYTVIVTATNSTSTLTATTKVFVFSVKLYLSLIAHN